MPRLSWLVKLYGNLTYVRMRPAAIALNYSVKDIRHDVRQIIYNNNNNNISWKIAIEQTSVGLAHAYPNNMDNMVMWQHYNLIGLHLHKYSVVDHGIATVCNLAMILIQWSLSEWTYENRHKFCRAVEQVDTRQARLAQTGRASQQRGQAERLSEPQQSQYASLRRWVGGCKGSLLLFMLKYHDATKCVIKNNAIFEKFNAMYN